MLLDTITADMKDAMRARDSLRTQVLRMIMSDCRNVEVDKRRELTEEDVLAVLKRGIKSREDSEDQYRNAGRADLADKEGAEVAILKTYLPRQISGPELEAIVAAAIQETGAAGPKDIGKVMKAVLAKCGAQVDGKEVNQVAGRKLTAG